MGEAARRDYCLVKCNGCGLIYLNPRPTVEFAGAFHREEGYDPFLSLSSRRSGLERLYAYARRCTLHWKRGLIEHLAASGANILDIGCGTGEFLYALKDKYHTYGIEPDSSAAAYARDRLGLVVFNGVLATTTLPDLKFDIVTLWHALEHIPDPVGALTIIRNILKPDGKVLIALPNIASLDARLYRHYWVALDAPRHLWHFTPRTIRLMAAKAGFALFKQRALPLDLFYNALWSEKFAASTYKFKLLLAPLRLAFITSASLICGFFSGQYSGMYYIFKKSHR